MVSQTSFIIAISHSLLNRNNKKKSAKVANLLIKNASTFGVIENGANTFHRVSEDNKSFP